MSDNTIFQLGDTVKHKAMSGRFIIRRLHADDTSRGVSTRQQPQYEIRGQDGNVWDVFDHELIKE